MKKVGTWEFGKLRELRDGMTIDRVLELAQERDRMGSFEAFDNGAAAFTIEAADVEEDGSRAKVKLNGREFVSDGAWDGLASRIRIPSRVLKDLEPELLEQAIATRYEPSKSGDVACLWGGDGVRGIVTGKYEHRKAMDTIAEGLGAADIDPLSAKVRAIGWRSEPDSWAVEMADIEMGFDVNKLGAAGPVPDDIVYPGWRLRSGDVGNRQEEIESYAWRLVCNNGSSVALVAYCLRKVHNEVGTWKGQVISTDAWKEIITSAKADKLEIPSKEWMSKRYGKFTNKVPREMVEDAFAALLAKDLRPDLSEIARESGFRTDKAPVDEVFPNAPSIFEVLSGMWTTRWELAQAFGRAANDRPADRERLQAQSGAVLLDIESSPFHELLYR